MRVTLIYPAIGRPTENVQMRSWEVQPLASAALKTEKLEQYCNDLRRRIYGTRSIATRVLDLRSNCGSLQRASIHWAANHSLSEDVAHREILPFGDRSFEGELIPT